MHELIECFKKNPATSVVIVIALAAFVYILYRRKENLVNNNNTMPVIISGPPVHHSKTVRVVGALCGAILSCILPLVILYYVTKSSAKAAIRGTVCANPEILINLFTHV